MHNTPAKRLPLIALLLIAGGCATTGDRGQPIIPEQYKTKTGPYVIFTNYALPTDDGVVKQLISLRAEVENTLGVHVEPGEHPIEVYILSDRKTYEHFVKFYYPELPARRAFFIAQGERRVVYTFKGDRLEEDIRHEASHALLNLAIGEIPLWLDEGLAEYFETTAPGGENKEHIARYGRDLEEGFSPDLTRLEGLKAVRAMTPRDYREAWAWVHYLLNESSDGRANLLGYIADLHKSTTPTPLSERLRGNPRDRAIALNGHVAKLAKPETIRENQPPATMTANPEPTLRLQNVPIEIEPIEPNPTKKRGFFSRMIGRMLD